MISTGIVATTPALRAGLRALLSSSDIAVSAEAASLLGIAAHSRELDGILVADELLLSDLHAIDFAARSLAVLVLADSSRASTALAAVDLPGWGIITPDVSPARLQAAMQAVVQGLVVVSPQLSSPVIRDPASTLLQDDTLPIEPLTGRENEVLGLLSQGLPNKLIAQRLGISEHTVKFHISSIYTKLGATNRAEAISRGARLGLIVF
ncbi:MAG: response regulator transcription factor [Chloroflexaceae bacterium]|nr:response regulator transcription factor [Chloroflexaceae bacterium]